ncbi:MAG: ABC transporter ATP-binding protein [Limnohabitans sp.]|nr:ABC transporter ATP-binding protein [Limnohabitans sp.]
MLNLHKLCSGYNELTVLHDIDLQICRGEIISVIGANGAGKSTLLLSIAGHLKLNSGRIEFAGQDIFGMQAHHGPAKGMVMVPEGARLFPFMTVIENLKLGAFHPKARAKLRERLDEVMTYFPLLAERLTQLAGRLSGGERQMCAIARAMMADPQLLMLDEPSLGLAPIMVDKVFSLIKNLVSSKGLSVLLVEQNVSNALQLSQRASILENGRILKSAPSRELLDDPDVQRSYMGL